MITQPAPYLAVWRLRARFEFAFISPVVMRIAIIGAGISGLTAAHVLAREHDITVLEAGDHIGGHTNTLTVDLGSGPCHVDTGFIVFNHRTYPSFTRLLAKLGVRSQKSSMSFSVRCDRTGLEYGSDIPGGLFAQRRNALRPSFLRMLADIARFYRTAPALLGGSQPGVTATELTVREYLRSARMSREFAEHFLIPLGASIWSCPAHRFSEFPMRFVVRFMHNHGMLTIRENLEWRVIRGGSWRYVQALTRPFRDRIRVRTPVAAVRRYPGHVAVVPEAGPPEPYDHVILACHSDQALAMLEDPSPLESEVLAAFPYQENHVALHTDESVLPRHRRAWSSWNYRIPSVEDERVSLTYYMNRLQSLHAPRAACVTVNGQDRIDPGKILARFRYHHPVFTTHSPRYQAMHKELIQRNRTSFCGAYWGFGFHEDGVKSALAVCRAFGLDLALSPDRG